MKVFKRGGFVILDDSGTEISIPLQFFDYQIIGSSLKMFDVAEKSSYSEALTSVLDVSGNPVGNADQIAAYLANIIANANKKEQLINNASDLVKTFTYLDAGTADERVSTIEYSSVSLGLTATETFVYAGSAGAYRISTITLS
tara:strand:- start:4179 stop:4607 length:429 start_codon:yes stop_codon:yes gene_type:complete